MASGGAPEFLKSHAGELLPQSPRRARRGWALVPPAHPRQHLRDAYRCDLFGGAVFAPRWPSLGSDRTRGRQSNTRDELSYSGRPDAAEMAVQMVSQARRQRVGLARSWTAGLAPLSEGRPQTHEAAGSNPAARDSHQESVAALPVRRCGLRKALGGFRLTPAHQLTTSSNHSVSDRIRYPHVNLDQLVMGLLHVWSLLRSPAFGFAHSPRGEQWS